MPKSKLLPTMWHKTFGPLYFEVTSEIPHFVQAYSLNVEFFPKGRQRNGPALYVDIRFGSNEYGLTFEHFKDVEELNGEIGTAMHEWIEQVFGRPSLSEDY